MTTRRPSGANHPTGKAVGEDDLTRLVRLIARQAAKEAFALVKDALETSIARARPPSDLPAQHEAAAKVAANKALQSPEAEERFLSVAEVAKRLDVSERTVRRKIKSGELPAHRMGKLIRIGESGLSACLARAPAGRNGGRQ
jgi:excisionase family DNA binding protein